VAYYSQVSGLFNFLPFFKAQTEDAQYKKRKCYRAKSFSYLFPLTLMICW
jgi:hypothetical protein